MQIDDMKVNPFDRQRLAGDILREWQSLLDMTAEILGVPAGLITRLDGNEIEIFLSSTTTGNPYQAEYVTQYPDSGWYCERTLKSRQLNRIPNALLEADWKDNPAAVSMQMISYIGLPIERPDGGEFGTVCFLDNKENAHNDLHIKLLHQVKRMIELSLKIVFDKAELDRRDSLLDDLSRIYPICSYCKKVREESGNWVSVEKYLKDITGALPTHGICPQCYQEEIKKL